MNPRPTVSDDGVPGPDEGGDCVAIVTERADGGRTCTISPLPASERALGAEWVLATDDSFVSLADVR